jgi:hypothetical protein
MGNSSSSSSSGSSSQNGEKGPAKDFVDSLNVAQKLFDEFKKRDGVSLVKFITDNKLMDIDKDFKDKIETHYKEFDDHLKLNEEYNILDNAGKKTYRNTQLAYPKFYELLKEIKNKNFKAVKDKIIESDIIKSNSSNKQSIENIFNNIATMRAKEEFYKNEYIITQIWMLSYLQNLNTGVATFITDTIKLVKENEERRNREAKEMIANIIKILSETDGNLNENDIKFFKEQFDKYQATALATSTKLVNNIEQAGNELTQQAANKSPAPGQSSTPAQGGKSNKNKKSTQKGGFVRDHSRFPQSFYELSNV